MEAGLIDWRCDFRDFQIRKMFRLKIIAATIGNQAVTNAINTADGVPSRAIGIFLGRDGAKRE